MKLEDVLHLVRDGSGDIIGVLDDVKKASDKLAMIAHNIGEFTDISRNLVEKIERVSKKIPKGK